MGLSVVIITKNESLDLPRALESVAFADEVVVFDSGSTDGTQALARSCGAKVFETADWPGFGPQKNRAIEQATHDWVLSLDADEWVEPQLAQEIRAVVCQHESTSSSPVAYRFRRRSIFIDRLIRFGDWRRDQVVRLFRRVQARFSDDLVHERLVPQCKEQGGSGSLEIFDLKGCLGHYSVRSTAESREKMWRYNIAASQRIASRGAGGQLKGALKAAFSLFRGLVLRLGLLDGWRGLQLAWFNAQGTYLRYALAQAEQDKRAWFSGRQTKTQRLRDRLHLIFTDHGVLRALYDNRYRLPGGLYRVNQPSPGRLAAYKQRLGIRTVVNLRGANDQLGWYRLEKDACRDLELRLVSIQVYSRGLVDQARFGELKELMDSIELPAIVHCKSGADRAGFFSVLYRHLRLGEPLETAMRELDLKFGHFKSAKTGVLDFFFETYLAERRHRQGLMDWVSESYDRERLQSYFQPQGISSLLVDRVLRRE